MLKEWDGMGLLWEARNLWTWFWEPARAESVILIRLLAVLLLLPSDSDDLFGENYKHRVRKCLLEIYYFYTLGCVACD